MIIEMFSLQESTLFHGAASISEVIVYKIVALDLGLIPSHSVIYNAVA